MTTLPVGNAAPGAGAVNSANNTLMSLFGAGNPLTGIINGALGAAAGGPSAATGAADSGAPVAFGSISFGGDANGGGGATDTGTFSPRADSRQTNPSAQVPSLSLPGLSGNPLISNLSPMTTPRAANTAATITPVPKNIDTRYILGAVAVVGAAFAYVQLS